MEAAKSAEITTLLKAWSCGDSAALDRLTPLVYDELRHLAHRYMRHERAGHTLQTTALVSEAYLRLADVKGVDWQDRAHFLAVSARIMRRILIEAARARAAAKRGGEMARGDHSTPFDFDQLAATGSDRATALCALDDALNTSRSDGFSTSAGYRAALLRRIDGRRNSRGTEGLAVRP